MRVGHRDGRGRFSIFSVRRFHPGRRSLRHLDKHGYDWDAHAIGTFAFVIHCKSCCRHGLGLWSWKVGSLIQGPQSLQIQLLAG